VNIRVADIAEFHTRILFLVESVKRYGVYSHCGGWLSGYCFQGRLRCMEKALFTDTLVADISSEGTQILVPGVFFGGVKLCYCKDSLGTSLAM
jgi:hypothetical protein